MEELFSKLMKKYETTGKIGPVKPFNREHAVRVAWAAAQSIINRQNKKLTETIKIINEIQNKQLQLQI